MPIRGATLDDVETLFELRRSAEEDLRLGDDAEEIERARCASDIAKSTGSCLVYQVDGKIAGFIYAQHLEKNGRKTGRIRYLYVVPEYRGRWINSKLYHECEAQLRTKNYGEIIFGTRHGNVVIELMGRRNGFQLLEKRGPLDFYIKVLQ